MSLKFRILDSFKSAGDELTIKEIMNRTGCTDIVNLAPLLLDMDKLEHATRVIIPDGATHYFSELVQVPLEIDGHRLLLEDVQMVFRRKV